MSLIAPLGLLLAAAGVLVVLLHMRLKRTVRVPSLAIWRRIELGQQKRSRKLGWPKSSWPLALQLLAVAVAALALAQPVLHGDRQIDHWVFLVDHSAAMNARGADGADLLDTAKRQLSDRLGTARSGELVSIIAVGDEAVPLAVRQRAEALGTALDAIEPEDSRAAWDRAAPVVQATMQPGEATAVIVVSDVAVAVPGLPEDVTTESVVLMPVTRADASLSAQLQPEGDKPFHYILSGEVLLEGGLGGTELVVSYAAEAGAAPLEWTRQVLGRPEAELASGPVTRAFSIPLELPGPGVVSVSVSSDANPSHDTAWFVTAPAPKPVRVLYIGDGGQPLLTAIAAVEGTEIYEAGGLPADSASYDLVVVDNTRIARQPEGNVVWIGDAGVADVEVAAGGALVPTASMSEHPLMAGVDWTGISVPEHFMVLGAAGETLLAANGVPLIVAQERNLRLLFDPRTSDWSQQSSLPVFVANLMDWLGLRAEGVVRTACLVGQSCVLDARFAGGTMERLDMPGEPMPLPVADFRPTNVGLYRVSAGERSELIAINAVVAPRADEAVVAEQPAPFPRALWPWLLALAVLVLLVEAIIAGWGSERFLRLAGLAKSSPLHFRRRIVLSLRMVTLGLLVLAAMNVPLPWLEWGRAVVSAGVSGQTPGRGGDDALALRLAAASLPFDRAGRLVVEGQGNLLSAEAQRLASEFNARDIVLDLNRSSAAFDSIVASAIEAPGRIYAGDAFELNGIVHSATATRATVTLVRDGVDLVSQDVDLVAGDNRIDTVVPEAVAGSADYSLRVGTGPAASIHRILDVRETGKVAVIAADPAQAAVFVDWLGTQEIVAEAVLPVKAPYKAADWRGYDGAVLLDLPAIALTTQQQQELQAAVANEGLGLLILGGPNTFGPGGYLETPLDELSPLSSRVPRDMPEATLVFVLDRSGSMQQPVGNETRLDVAKQATLSAVKLLNARSQVGIVVFDAEATTVLPLSEVNADAVAAAMSTVDPGGGTEIYPGLEAAFNMLRGLDSPARHIVVMTDGLSQPADYPALLARIRAEGITVSAVSIGKGAERELVAEIARLGSGTFHATDDFAALPSILSQEAMLLSGAPIEERRTQPLWASRSEPFLRGLPETMPPIDGFVLTTPKPEATLSMAVLDSRNEAMPLLASWRYGNGSVLALATDAVGPWSAEWQQLPGYSALWSQALRQFLPPVDRRDLTIALAERGDGIEARVALAGALRDLAPALVATAGDITSSVPLQRIRPGLYEGRFYPTDAGPVTFEATAGDAEVSATTYANYPAHLRPVLREDGLAQLAAATARPDGDTLHWHARPLWQAWLAAGVALLLLELAVRYTGLIRPASPLNPHHNQPTGRRRETRTESAPVAA